MESTTTDKPTPKPIVDSTDRNKEEQAKDNVAERNKKGIRFI